MSLAVSATTDRLDILDLLHRYAMAVDERDGNAVADCFTENGLFASSLTGSTQGRDAIRQLFTAKRERPADSRRHFVANPVISLQGNRATFRAYFLATRIRDGRVEVALTGQYRGVAVKEGDQWRLAERHMSADIGPKDWA